MNAKIIGVAFLFLLAKSSSALTYEQALDKAIGYDKKYASAVLEQKSSDYLSTIARASLLAKVSINGFQAVNRLNQRQADIFGNPNTTSLNYGSQSYTAQITQPLINLAAIANYIGSNRQEEAQRAKLAIAFNDLAINVANAYATLGAAKETLFYSKKELETLENQEKIVTARKREGISSQSDIEEVLYSKAQAKVSLDEATNALVQAQITLEKLTGEMMPANEPISFIVSQKIIQHSLGDLIELAKSGNPRIIYQQKNYETANYEHERNKAAYAPTVDLVAAQSFQNSGTLSTINQKSLQTYAGFQLTIPIFEGGSTYGKERQSAYYADSQRVLVESEVNDVRESIQKDYEQLRISNLKYKSLEEQVKSAKFLFSSIDRQRVLGAKSTYDLMTYIRRQFQSERDAAKAKYEAALSSKKLEINTGLTF